MKKLLFLISLYVVMLSGCREDEDVMDSNEPLPHTLSPTKWWILAHGSGGNSGIYLYDEENSKVDLKFNIPPGMTSPHALAFDGKSLWLGGAGDNQFLYELSPLDGSILSKMPNVHTEGIACSNDEIYYSQYSQIFKVKKNGVRLDTLNLKINVVNDIAIYNSTLYYVVNGATDPVFRFDQATSERKELFDTEVIGIYTLTIYDNYFVVVDDANRIIRFDIGDYSRTTGSRINIPVGWITAIAPFNVSNK